MGQLFPIAFRIPFVLSSETATISFGSKVRVPDLSLINCIQIINELIPFKTSGFLPQNADIVFLFVAGFSPFDEAIACVSVSGSFKEDAALFVDIAVNIYDVGIQYRHNVARNSYPNFCLAFEDVTHLKIE